MSLLHRATRRSTSPALRAACQARTVSTTSESIACHCIQAEDLHRSFTQLTSYPGNVEQADLDALGQHFSNEQVIELALAIATANWTNRVNDGLQVPLR